MRRQRALVIGGTGPTGPGVVEGLFQRGFDVTILHGGQHEVELPVPNVRHVHEDPHFRETFQRGIENETFDLVIAQYGRLGMIADVLAGRTTRLLAIGAAHYLYADEHDERWGIIGRPAFVADTSAHFVDGPERNKIAFRAVEAMMRLFENHSRGAYAATYLAYPANFGPRQHAPHDWCVVKRLLDGRNSIVIADGGIKLESRLYTANAVNAVLLAVDNPVTSAGKRYTVADESVYSLRQRIEFTARHLGRSLDLIDMPYEIGWPCYPLWHHHRGHQLCQSTLIRDELGYKDLVVADEALERSIDWLVANHPSDEDQQQLGDPFNYELEDQLTELWRGISMGFAAIEPPLRAHTHPYRHPKVPGAAWEAQ